MTERTERHHARPVAPDDSTWLVGMRAAWLVGLIAKQMNEQPDGGCLKDFITDSATLP